MKREHTTGSRTADVSLRLSPLERPRDTVRRSWTIEGRSFVYFTRRRMPKKPTIRGVPWPRSTRAQTGGHVDRTAPARNRNRFRRAHSRVPGVADDALGDEFGVLHHIGGIGRGQQVPRFWDSAGTEHVTGYQRS